MILGIAIQPSETSFPQLYKGTEQCDLFPPPGVLLKTKLAVCVSVEWDRNGNWNEMEMGRCQILTDFFLTK